MVFIKKLEIYGFKSFGFKNTILNFENGLVAVTGPNGSGKSNVLDAIMFSIGENSPKALRVDKFQSLFHDSENPSHRLVRVSITFDNKDRGIPVDSDNVTLTREMEGSVGESNYLLNGKKVNKSAILELLEIIIAVPNKLNIVQQGMITRISELNTDERRKIIEEIVGLSYFDEKKEEAMKQLDESDRRLEVALARMNEIRKRIDELESERNDQLRFEYIEREIKNYKSIKLSNDIKQIRNKILGLNETSNSSSTKLTIKSKELEETKGEREKLESEKMKFIQEINVINKKKAEISTKITPIVYESEKMRAMNKESEQRLGTIKNRLPVLEENSKEREEKVDDLSKKIETFSHELKIINEKRGFHEKELDKINTEFEMVTNKLNMIENYKKRVDERFKKIIFLKNRIEVDKIRVDERLIRNEDKKSSILSRISEINEIINSEGKNLEELNEKYLLKEEKKRDLLEKIIINNKKSLEFEKEIENSKKTLLETDDTSLRYSEKTKVLSDIMLEDFVIAKIKKSDYRNMVLGTVKDLVRWEQKYERAILAAASELMNVMVVNKTEEMAAIAEYVKIKNLPRIKIISLDIIKKYNQENIFEKKDVLHIGRLSDFVISKHKELVTFVFGNTVVTRTASDAYLLSKKGCRVVSINGELFDPNSELVTLDFGTKIQDITRDILLSESIEKLRELVVKLKNIIENKIQEYNNILYTKSKIELENAQIEIHTNEIQNQIKDKKRIVENCSQENIQLNLEKEYLKKEEMDMVEEIGKYTNRIEKIEKTAGMLFQKINSINDSRFRNQLAEISIKKNQILKTIEKIDLQIQQIMIQDISLKNEYESNQEKIKMLFDEIKELKEEYIRRENQITLFNQKLDENELELKSLRDKEQELIDMSGDSYSVLQNFEQKLKILYDDERRLSKETNTLEKEIALLQKELSTLANLENKLLNDLMWYGHKELLNEDYEVGEIINALEEEYDLLKSQINLRASETYVQVIEGYRGMSQRRNELEKERNSIVLFVNEIIKEKESMFIAAFKKVNEDIQSIFSKIIGGSAWLEIENEEDIFGSGVRLVVQFPGKPKRESTSLSGGEKTMAATVFLLALQTIKPSPFYLMDEVDAHLDGQNTERLSNILFERAKNSQIIMVSLKDSLISKVNQVYGVYPKNGVSQLVKYKFPQNYTQDKILSIEQK